MKKRKIIALITAVVMTLSMVFALPVVQVEAETSYDVPVKVKAYYNNYLENTSKGATVDNAIWDHVYTREYKFYKNGDLKSTIGSKIKWTKKKGIPTKVNTGSIKKQSVATYTYKKGKLSKATFKLYNDKGKYTGKGTEEYTYKKGWITKVSGKVDGSKYKFTYVYEFYKNGMPKTIEATEIDYGDTLTTTYSFNKKGLVTKKKTNMFKQTFKYKYDSKNRISEVIEFDDGLPMYRYVYKYGGSKTKDKRTYMAVFNMSDELGIFRDVAPSAYAMLANSGG